MLPKIELESWSQIMAFAMCEALERAGMEYAHDLTNTNTCFIGIKPGSNMLAVRMAISSQPEYTHCQPYSTAKGNIQLSINNPCNCLIYNLNTVIDNIADPNFDPYSSCEAIIKSIKHFNAAQDALFGLIQKSTNILWHFDYNFNNEIDHWIMITGDMSPKEARELIEQSKDDILQESGHALHDYWYVGINGVPLREFYDEIDTAAHDEMIDVVIAYLKHYPNARKFVVNGEIE